VTFALDTNIVVELLRGGNRALLEKYLSHPPRAYSVPEMVRAELLFGARISRRRSENLEKVEQFLVPLRLLPFAGAAVEQYGEIRARLSRSGTPIGPNDLIIAATVRSQGHTLVTRDTREFARVPALSVEDW